MSETDALEALAALAEVIHIGDLDCEIPEEHGAQAAALLRDRGWQLTRVGDEERLRAELDRIRERWPSALPESWLVEIEELVSGAGSAQSGVSAGPAPLGDLAARAAFAEQLIEVAKSAHLEGRDRELRFDENWTFGWCAAIEAIRNAALAPQPPSPASQGEER